MIHALPPLCCPTTMSCTTQEATGISKRTQKCSGPTAASSPHSAPKETLSGPPGITGSGCSPPTTTLHLACIPTAPTHSCSSTRSHEHRPVLLPITLQSHQAHTVGHWLLILLSFQSFPKPSSTWELHTLTGTALWGTAAAAGAELDADQCTQHCPTPHAFNAPPHQLCKCTRFKSAKRSRNPPTLQHPQQWDHGHSPSCPHPAAPTHRGSQPSGRDVLTQRRRNEVRAAAVVGRWALCCAVGFGTALLRAPLLGMAVWDPGCRSRTDPALQPSILQGLCRVGVLRVPSSSEGRVSGQPTGTPTPEWGRAVLTPSPLHAPSAAANAPQCT